MFYKIIKEKEYLRKKKTHSRNIYISFPTKYDTTTGTTGST